MVAHVYDRHFIDFSICTVSTYKHHISGSSVKSIGYSYRCQNIFGYLKGKLGCLVKKKLPQKIMVDIGYFCAYF